MSEFKPLSLEIPQGSVLGPILFLLFINDITHIIHNCHICIFADDITLYFSGNNFNHDQSVLQADLSNVLKWLDENRLFVNANKYSYDIHGIDIVRNQENLTSSCRPNSGGIKENQSNPMACPEY